MLKENRGVQKNIIRVEEDNKTEMSDLVAREKELSIFVNKKKIISLYCSPGDYKYLGIGFLFTAGILSGKDDIVSIETKKDAVYIMTKKNIFSSGRIKRISSMIEVQHQFPKMSTIKTSNTKNFKLNPSIVYRMIEKIQEKAAFFKLSGGVHSCALADKNGKILLFSEDISRYNTIDRVLGQALLTDIDTSNKILLTSCRITSGIIKKVIFSNIQILISRAAVTDCAIKIADVNNITLIGFTRGKRMNIYAHSRRILI
jgi:FdhD protein